MSEDLSAQEKIDKLIGELDDWRGAKLAQARAAVLAADPEIIEEWKWMGSPVWSHSGTLLVGNAHKDKVKLTFAYGASLADPDGLFNGKDTGNTRRSIDIFKDDAFDGAALTDLVKTAIAYNGARAKARAGKK